MPIYLPESTASIIQALTPRQIVAELDKYVPYLTEDELVKRGAIYKKAAEPWLPFAVADQRVITGQNPASGGPVADLVLKALAA